MEITEGMRAFAKKYNRSLDDPKLKDLYELDLSARRDLAAIAYTAEAKGRAEGYAEGFAEGWAEGYAEGRAEGRAEVIQAMLRYGIPEETVCRIAGATREEMKQIVAREQG